MIVSVPGSPFFRLRTIEKYDNSNLRKWKNDNRNRFFYQEIINIEQQEAWFEDYMKRESDVIFVLEERYGEEEYKPIGCLGYRVDENNKIDLYNIIRGNKSRSKASMKDAMKVLLSYLISIYEYPIKCDVLKDNPAVLWYQQCGFEIWEEKEYYYIIGINRNEFTQIEFMQEEIEDD